MKSAIRLTHKIRQPGNEKIYQTYLKEITGFKPLGKDKELVMFEQIKQGNKTAEETIIKHNALFVVSCAFQYQGAIKNSNLVLEDLISEGNYGLIVAARKFDHTRDVKFISYAVHYVKSYIMTCIQQHIKNVRVPANKLQDFQEYKRAVEQMSQIVDKDPDIQEVWDWGRENGFFKKMSCFEDLLFMHDSMKFESSLDSPFKESGESDLSLIDVTKNENSDDPHDLMVAKTRTNAVETFLDSLPSRIRNYFLHYYGLRGEKQKTLNEIGEMYEMIPQTVSNKMQFYIKRYRSKFKGVEIHEMI